jgi:hypothetical protein
MPTARATIAMDTCQLRESAPKDCEKSIESTIATATAALEMVRMRLNTLNFTSITQYTLAIFRSRYAKMRT